MPPIELVGRDDELATGIDRLAAGSVLTITGPGGVGKTRLAFALAQLAREPPESFPDGAFVCELAALHDPETVALALADAVGIVRSAESSAYDSLATGLDGRSALILLDNCDPVVGGTSRLLAQLVDDCPGLAAIVTSRQPLGIAAENVLELGPLDAETDAPALFVQRALEADPLFVVGPNRDSVASICRDLDGLPLALELAAARLSTMSVVDLARRLDRRFSVLRDEQRIGRHETMYATISWSYDLLDRPERELFDRLSVFQGGFDLEAVEAVAGRRPADAQRDLRSLVAKSMVVVGPGVEEPVEPSNGDRADAGRLVGAEESTTPGNGNGAGLIGAPAGPAEPEGQADGLIGAPAPVGSGPGPRPPAERFELLETLRQFGDRQLAARGERSGVRNDHLVHMMDVLGATNSLALGAGWRAAVRGLTLERDNIRTAVNWAVDTVRMDDVDRMLRDLFFSSRWRIEAEPASWAARAIERGVETGSPAGAPAHLHVAYQHFLAGDHEAALAANLAGLEAGGTPSDRSWCRNYAAVELLYLGRTEEAADMADAMMLDPSPRRVERAMQRSSHAVFKLYAGHVGAGDALASIGLADRTAQSTGSVVAIGHVAYNRGLCELARGDRNGFRAAMAEATRIARANGIATLTGYLLAAQVYTPGPPGMRAALDALEYWAHQRDLSNEFVVLEATGLNLNEAGRIEESAVILGNLERGRRRMASSAARRETAMNAIQLDPRATDWIERGAAMHRAELLAYAKSALADALA